MQPFPRVFDPPGGSAAEVAASLRRFMARDGLTASGLAQRSGLHDRTVKGLLAGSAGKPHAKTLHKLAEGLGVAADELLCGAAAARRAAFDRATNPIVEEAVATRPELFAHWGESHFDELASRFGAGGELTLEGACQAADEMNRRHEIQVKVAVILETAEADLLTELVETLYRRVTITPGSPLPAVRSPS